MLVTTLGTLPFRLAPPSRWSGSPGMTVVLVPSYPHFLCWMPFLGDREA